MALHGGKTKGSNFIVGDPLLGCDPSLISENDMKVGVCLNFKHTLSVSDRPNFIFFKKMNDAWLCESSSLIWVCSSNERRSFATILDANNPNNILECFVVCSSHLLCVASVSGFRLT